MDKGTRFVPARNPSQNTEEIFFCIQSGTMDIPLFVDTAYPGLPIFMGEKDLEGSFGLYPLQQRKYAALSYGEKKKAGLN